MKMSINAFKLLLSCLLPATAWATSVGGAVRNLTLDGVVTTGASPGTNGPDWEADEFLQGYQGAVNWYATWDDDNLYLGRIGGNNAEGSVIYLHADYSGASYATQGFTYDQLMPELGPMGGANFAAYVRTGYNETRRYDNGWTPAATNLVPAAFSNPGNGANMELRIPWNDITGGNGRPDRVRFVLYQVVPPGGTCPQEFVYGESPWGTGNVGDGPSTGVNDGVGVSARQPGGCDVGDSTATRWWGCYPLRGGIGLNDWAFQSGSLALDSATCLTGDSLALQSSGAGTWSQVGGPVTGGIARPGDAQTLVGGLSMAGTYTFVFTQQAACETLADTVRYRLLTATALSLGADTTACDGDTLCFSPSPLAALGSILWSDGSSGGSLCTAAAGHVWMQATDTNGCASGDSLLVTHLPAPVVTGVTIDSSNCPTIVLGCQYTSTASAFDWDLGMGQHHATQTATQDYTAWGNGLHPYTLTVGNACGSNTTNGLVSVHCLVGIEAGLDGEWAFFPNPTAGTLVVDMPAGATVRDLRVTDALGRTWARSGPFADVLELDLPGMADGMYLLQLRLEDGEAKTWRGIKQ